MEIEGIDELCQLLDGHLDLVIACRRHHIICFLILFIHGDTWQKVFIDNTRLHLSFEVCEEEFLKLINRDETLLVINHLIQLLLEVVEDPVVHGVLVNVHEHLYHLAFILSPTCQSDDLLAIVFNHSWPHWLGPLLLGHLLLLGLVLPPLRQLDSVQAHCLHMVCLFCLAIVADLIRDLIQSQV